MVEAAGGSIVWVEGDPGNLKLTYPEDLQVMEAML
jgi:2-C-methyl-D-erythritol 4-phosphate cytidylyltransferase